MPEGDDFEVKSQCYENGDGAKRELCADLAAFANASGGLLVIGASESGDVVNAVHPPCRRNRRGATNSAPSRPLASSHQSRFTLM